MTISTHDIFVLLNYISVFVMFGCCVMISTHFESRMSKLALLVCSSLTMCCLGFLFRSEAVNAESYIIGQKLVYAFVSHGMFLMLLFILEYCKFQIPSYIQYIFHGINFLISFVVLTLNYHTFFYKSYWAVPIDNYCIVEKEYGFMHSVAVAIFALYMVAACVITIIFSIKNIRKKKRYVWRLFIAVLLPCISYIIPKFTDLNTDLQPIAFAVFSLMVLLMIYKNNLYDVENIAVQFSIASVNEALIVFDEKYLFKGCNKRAEELFPVLRSLNLDGDIRQDSDLMTDFIDEKVTEYHDNNEIYSVSVVPVMNGHVVQGKVVKLENITLQRQYTDLLQASKEHLESEVVTLSGYSYTDELTGLRNRRSFEETVSQLNADENVLIGSADLNGLKETNDNICHAAGDELLKGAAEILKQFFLPYGNVFRTGGDEFYIILTTPPENMAKLTAQFDDAINRWHGKLAQNLSISYGFVRGGGSKTVDQLLIEADKIMYENKRRYYEQAGIDRRKH